MKRFLLTAIMIFATAPVLVADAGVSVTVGQPGFYGHIDIGNQYPQPQLIYREPIIVQRVPVVAPPIYMRVPPGHAKHWKKHCHEYNACNRPVYFVQDDWYTREYVPRYRQIHEHKEKGHDSKKHGKHNGDHKGHHD